MRKILFLACLAVMAIVAAACGSDAPQSESPSTGASVFSASVEKIDAFAEGDLFTVVIKCDKEWFAYSYDEWLTAAKTASGTLDVTVAKNTSAKSRAGKVYVTSGTRNIEIAVEQAGATVSSDINVPDGYELVWHDEFDEGTTLGSDWTHEVQNSGWVNNELQNYVDHTSPGGRNVTELKDGKLCINCFKENGKVYSGRVYAHVSEGWLYGYFEARILLPSGKGTWPAFWMMPANNDWTNNPWPNCGEIDIMEEVGCVPNEVSSSIHTKSYNHTLGTQKTKSRNIGTAESEYHVYACEWTKDKLRFYVDGSELMTFNNEGTGKDVWPFTYAFYPILNLAWGGSWGGMYGVDESALPVTMQVDYVRVFQKK